MVNSGKLEETKGSARKIKDNAADWHNLILKWEALNDTGFATANNIANLKTRLWSEDAAELQSSPASGEDADKTLPEYSKELETLCEELQTTFDALGVCELENYHCGDGRHRPPLFHTWPTAHFYEVSRQLSDMYQKELLLKRTVIEELVHTTDHDLTLSYLSMWLHQPFVETNGKLLLESMLLETGHRAL
ncbi:hypothetical protein GH733_002085 [Mirounga leonina]|nr:hypothetical protein GH733_002085 [Mirounga leonina]